jgi:hypothetical protein
MKLGIMQPYFFPYLGYFDLINRSDKWIVFDTVQYIRHGWINRNRILHPRQGWSYITVPVTCAQETPIREVQIANDGKWKKRIQGQMQHYKKSAPYWSPVSNLLEEVISFNTTSISELNVFSLAKVCEYLNIVFDYLIFSEMNLELGTVAAPGDWALRISQELGASEYINPPGGEALFDKKRFADLGIKLTIQSFINYRYSCGEYEFEPALSILDLMMWNSPGEIKQYLEISR